MKIVFNGLQFTKYNSGIGKMMRELFSLIASSNTDKSVLILPKGSQESIKNVEIIKIPYKNSQGVMRNFYQTFIIGKKYCKNSILIVTDSKVPFFMPKNSQILPIITDLALYEMPYVYKFSRVFLWKLQYRYLIKHTHKYVAVSEYTKEDINRFLGIPKEKIDVVYCACDDAISRVDDVNELKSVKEKYNLPDKYFLFIGNLNPRKNLIRLYEAYKALKDKLNITHKLVIAGEYGWKYKKILNMLKSDSDIVFTGYIEEKDKSALYTMADIFVFPSLYEGFGIPILEAQKCGVPVITSNVSAMPEISGVGAVLINPYDVNDIKNAIEKIIIDKEFSQNLVNKGYENVKRFSWKDSAKKINKIIEKMEEK